MRIRYWSSDVCSSDLFGCRLYMGVQKFQDRTISGDLVRLLAKPMSFVGKDEIFDRDVVCLYLCIDILGFDGQHTRSAERRVGKECVSTCRSRWSPDHSTKKSTELCRQ